MKHSEKNCYQQHIFELMNKKMQMGSSSNLGILRDGRLVTRPLKASSIKKISVAVSANRYFNYTQQVSTHHFKQYPAICFLVFMITIKRQQTEFTANN